MSSSKEISTIKVRSPCFPGDATAHTVEAFGPFPSPARRPSLQRFEHTSFWALWLLFPLEGGYSASESATQYWRSFFNFFLEYPDYMIKTNECARISLNTFGTQLRVIEALFAEGIYMVQRRHDGPTTSGCDKMMTKDERRKRGPK